MYKYCIPLKYHTGNRVIKSHGPMTTIYINGVLQGVDMHDDENYNHHLHQRRASGGGHARRRELHAVCVAVYDGQRRPLHQILLCRHPAHSQQAGQWQVRQRVWCERLPPDRWRKRLCRTVSTNGKGSTRLLQAGGRHSGCTQRAGTTCQPLHLRHRLSECAIGQLRCTDRLAWSGGTQAAGAGVRSSGQFLKGGATRGEVRCRL